MYLKSLTLKGFKSFADRTQMVFDPGLTVVVGPNGSGKSNISDAILWVLGEQSAKQLRGQAMEDVIFAGSSARPAVSVAEVTLVLDNADHTLPIDFAEVGITRRMYRSGESEYLINGAPSRLRDVQDILHDSGLGKDTHSIISQGKLDSVLSSRPEERRALIEEAADISKHRRRLERSERKLVSMDESVSHAKVQLREVERQLKPLERQVDKATRAHDLESELSTLTIELAVDDLRVLQRDYSRLQAKGREADAAVELAQYRLDERSSELERYQSLLEQKGIFVGDLGEQRRRMQDILGRLDSDMRLLEEKGRNMVSRLSDMRMQLSTMKRQRSKASEELESVENNLSDVRVKRQELESSVETLTTASREASARRSSLDAQIADLTNTERTANSEADRETLAYAKLEEQVSSAQVEDQMYASRLSQINDSERTASEALAERKEAEKRLTDELASARAHSDEVSTQVRDRSSELTEARKAESTARNELSQAKATLQALRSVDADVESTSPLVTELARDAEGLVDCRLADLLDAAPEDEGIIENLLGDDLAALVVGDDAAVAQLVARARTLRGTDGRATLLSRGREVEEPVADAPGRALIDGLHTDDETRGLLTALLGNVRVVSDAEAAIAAHAEVPACTYVSSDGVVVLPDGRVRVGSLRTSETGSLERKRRIRELEGGMGVLEQALSDASAKVAAAEMALAEAREEAASAKGEVSSISAELKAATSERGRLEAQVSKAASERTQVEASRERASKRASEATSQIDQHRAAAAAARERAESAAASRAELDDTHEEAIRAQSKASHELSDARLSLATTKERERNLESRRKELKGRLDELDRRISATEKSSRALEVVRLRVDPLHKTYEAIRERALEWAARLKDRASLAEADSDSLKKTIGDAKEAVAKATDELDRAKDASSEVKVGLSRIEAKVESAIDSIVSTGAVLDDALKLPVLEDREAALKRQEEVKRQLDSIGPVNEVAMDEYQRLKARADYLSEQLNDLESARGSIRKVTKAIERKMRKRYVSVFDQVNRNFGEIFSMLFPGGSAHIEMTDPSDPLNSGVEVIAQPRGKKLTKMTLMSGGEKSLTALALLFAVYRVRTVPFYVFDEVEAALDDSNLSRLLDAIEQLKESTQLIVISHQRRTMEQADVLYGVSMQADGVSRVVSQRLDRVTGKVVDA